MYLIRKILSLLVIAAASVSVTLAQDGQGKKYAILVGVRQYDRNQLRNLPFAENDVAEVAEILEKSNFRRVELLTQSEGANESRRLPTAKVIREALKGILEDRGKNDLVLVAFAGHGVQFKGETEHYFCPMDAVLTDRSTLISLTDVYEQLKQSNAGAKLLLVDACRNDPLAGIARDASETLSSETRPQIPDPPGGVAAFFSCSAGQQAFEDHMLKHGIFFHHVILGLKGAAKSKKKDEVTWDNLVAYVKEEVPDTVKELIGNTVRQIPEHKGELRGTASLIETIRPTAPGPTSRPKTRSRDDLPKEITSKSTGMRLALIPAGEFMMGSSPDDVDRLVRDVSDFKRENVDDEQPRHPVKISHPFYMGKYEVTLAEFLQFYHDAKYQLECERDPKGGWGYDVSKRKFAQKPGYLPWSWGFEGQTPRHPVVNVSWNDAKAFCMWLSKKDGVNYRLPTEAEWEYACRAGTTTRHPAGDQTSLLVAIANVADQSASRIPGTETWKIADFDDGQQFTAPVGSFKPNAFGLHDMIGNVWEWCDDVYDKDAYKTRIGLTTDPFVTSGSKDRVMRGGSWFYVPKLARSAIRAGYSPKFCYLSTGFRVVAVTDSVRTP